jgi:hypothetical protein
VDITRVLKDPPAAGPTKLFQPRLAALRHKRNAKNRPADRFRNGTLDKSVN